VTVSIRKLRIIVLVSNLIKYWSNYSIRNFEYSHSTNCFPWQRVVKSLKLSIVYIPTNGTTRWAGNNFEFCRSAVHFLVVAVKCYTFYTVSEKKTVPVLFFE